MGQALEPVPFCVLGKPKCKAMLFKIRGYGTINCTSLRSCYTDREQCFIEVKNRKGRYCYG